MNRPRPRTNCPAVNFPVGPIIIGFNCACVCGHKRFDLLYHLYTIIYTLWFFVYFLLLVLYTRCITSSVWFALFQIFLLIGNNNNNEEKITATIIMICIIMAGETITYTQIRVAHCPLVVVVVEYAHTDTQMASFVWHYTYTYILYFFLLNFFCRHSHRLLLFADQLFNEIDALICFVCLSIHFFLPSKPAFSLNRGFLPYWPYLVVIYSRTLQIYWRPYSTQ